MKRFIVIFIICFLGTSCLLFVDDVCKTMTGKGGALGLYVKRVDEKWIEVGIMGRERHLNL